MPSGTQNTRPTWLVLVYMQASDSSQLDSLAVQDLVELQAGIQGADDGNRNTDANANVAALVQINRKWPGLEHRYLIEADKPVTLLRQQPAAAVDRPARPTMTQASAAESEQKAEEALQRSLEDFLQEGKRLGQELGARYVCVVLWGHAYGLGFGRDHGKPLRLKALGESIGRGFGDRPVDLIATNSCTMAYVEAAFELMDAAQYLVASQVFMPFTGFPYRTILNSIGPATAPEDLGKLFVTEYFKSFAASQNGEKVAMSLLRLDRARVYPALLTSVARNIRAVIEQRGRVLVQDTLSEIQDVFLANPAGDVRPVLDLQSLAGDLARYCRDRIADGPGARTGIAQPAPSSLEALERSAEDLRDGRPRSAKGEVTPGDLVIYQDRNGDLGSLGGVGVFAPFVIDSAARQILQIESPRDRESYRELKIFAGAPEWPDLVYDTLQIVEPDEVVDATGIVRPLDRSLVNQLVAAVDAAFSTLDRTIAAVHPRLRAVLTVRPDPAALGVGAPFGPPLLRLAGDLTLQPRHNGRPDARMSSEIVELLQRLEGAASLAENTVKRVLTNGRFGLGPPASGFGPPVKSQGLGPPVKSQGLGPPVKSQGLGPPVKSQGLGPPVKSQGLGPDEELGVTVGAATAFLSSDTQIAVLGVMELFRSVTLSMQNLEQGVADVESAVGAARLQPHYGEMLTPAEYAQAVAGQLGVLFTVLAESALQARRTAKEVMLHPVYGLGEGPDDFGQVRRDELAAAAGLSSRALALL